MTNDDALIARMALKDRDAMDEFYGRFSKVVFSLAYRIAHDATLAADATQDAFLQVLRDAARYDQNRGTVRAWILTIARARALDRLRASRSGLARFSVPLESGDNLIANSVSLADPAVGEQQATVATLLALLPARDRRIIHLAYVEGLTHVEIADRMGEPLGSIKTHLRRVLTLLRTAVDEDAPRPFVWQVWAHRQAAAVRQALDNVNVLVVDDDPDTIKLVKMVLQRAGAHVQAASSAIQALRALKSHWPDLLLTDIGMPDRDGYALLSTVRALCRGRGADLPAVAFTAHDSPAEESRARQAGFIAHITKPVRPSILVQRIAELVRHAGGTVPIREPAM